MRRRVNSLFDEGSIFEYDPLSGENRFGERGDLFVVQAQHFSQIFGIGRRWAVMWQGVISWAASWQKVATLRTEPVYRCMLGGYAAGIAILSIRDFDWCLYLFRGALGFNPPLSFLQINCHARFYVYCVLSGILRICSTLCITIEAYWAGCGHVKLYCDDRGVWLMWGKTKLFLIKEFFKVRIKY